MLRNQKGFTLIEIIAVLVILGILAAVAIPKFLSLQDDAKLANAQAAVAAGQSALSMGYAKTLLNSAGAPASPVDACTQVSLNAPSGVAYTVACTGAWTDSTAGITGTYDSVVATGSWTRP